MIRNVLFDCGGVVCEFVIPEIVARYFDPEDCALAQETLFSHWADMDAGDIRYEDYAREMIDRMPQRLRENTVRFFDGWYRTQPPIEDNKDEPIEVGGVLEFDAEVQANHIVYYNLYKLNDTTLTINNPNAYVIYNNKTYKAVNGVVTVPDLYVRYTNQPIKVAIGNEGTKDATFHVEFSYPEGHTNNPIDMSLGSFTANVKANNEVGVFYQWVASADGTLTLTVDGITEGVSAAIVMTRVEIIGEGEDRMEIPHTVALGENGESSVSIELKAGEYVKIAIGTQPVKNKYPAASIDVTVSFA